MFLQGKINKKSEKEISTESKTQESNNNLEESAIEISANEKIEVDNYIYDNSYFLDQWRKYENEIGTPKFENLKKINILIVGDSNGRDLFNAINLNKNLFHEYEFSFYRDQISDFFEIINALSRGENIEIHKKWV